MRQEAEQEVEQVALALEDQVNFLPRFAIAFFYLGFDANFATSDSSGRASPNRTESPTGLGPVLASELIAACPATGMIASDLMKLFTLRVGEGPMKTPKTEFIKMVKDNLKYGGDKKLRPR